MKTFVCDSFVMFSFADFMYNGTDLPCTATRLTAWNSFLNRILNATDAAFMHLL